MSKKKQYIFNKETLSYEVAITTLKTKLTRVFIVLLGSLLLFFGYYCIYTKVLNIDTPKTVLLEKKNQELLSKLEIINQKMDEESKILSEIQMRDNVVYRPIFGMDEIPDEVRNAGFGGVKRYYEFDNFINGEILTSVAMKMDILTKKAYVQSRSFDEVALLSKRAGEMASCIPTIYPVSTASRNKFSSSFGYRIDPFNKTHRMHNGIDISGSIGEPVYSTGDGVVSEVSYNFFGYGNCVIVDHGFGYKTRYAHLKEPLVVEGQVVKRGDNIGKMGNSGRSKGPHLHYEVIFKGKPINPVNYFTNDLDPVEYQAMIHSSGRDKI